MASNPAVLFYTADYLVGTMLMTYEQKGKYMELLCLQHQQGPLSEETMLSVCGGHDEKVFSKFVLNEDGLYYNPRMETERLKRENFCRVRSENGAKGGRPKNLQKSYSLEKATAKLGDNDNNSTITTNIKQITKVARTREDVENSNVENSGCSVENLERRMLPENFDDIVVEFFQHEQLNGDPRDFYAYNNERGWRGVGGEDMLKNNTWQRYAYKYSDDVENKQLWRYNEKVAKLLERKTNRR